MRVWLVAIFVVLSNGANAAGIEYSSTNTRGFFSVGLQYGLVKSRLLNTDGTFAAYDASAYGVDLDILLWSAGTGDIRFFGLHTQDNGKSTSVGENKIATGETVFGIKFFVGSHLYLAGGIGNGSTKLSIEGEPSLTLSYQMVKALFGVEFQLSDSFHAGLELSYRNAPIRRSGNSSLSENTYTEGMGAALRLVWSPPSVTFSPVSK